MYVGKLKLLFHPEIDKPILLNSPIQADLLVILILCGAHALNYINATGENWVCMLADRHTYIHAHYSPVALI